MIEIVTAIDVTDQTRTLVKDTQPDSQAVTACTPVLFKKTKTITKLDGMMQPLVVGDIVVDFGEFAQFEVSFRSASNSPVSCDQSDVKHPIIDENEYLSIFIEKCNSFIENTNSAFTIEQLVREILKVTQHTTANIENDLYNLIGSFYTLSLYIYSSLFNFVTYR